MASEGRHYRFPPLERRGLVAGLGTAQLALLAGGGLAAIVVLRLAPSIPGLLMATAVVALAGAGAGWTVGGRPPAAWTRVAGGWLWRRMAWSRSTDAPTVGSTPAGAPRLAPPRPLAGVSISAAPSVPGSAPMGVVRDHRAGTVAAVAAVRGRSFSLLDPEEKERRLAAWGAVLAGLCRDGSPVYRLQWVERAIPGDCDGLQRYLDEAGAAEAGVSRDSYADLIVAAGPVGQIHETLVVLAIHPRRAGRARRAFGHGPDALCGLLRRELRLLQGQLRSAELVVDRVLGDCELAAVLRAGVDLVGAERGGAVPRRRRPPGSAWPMATDEAWSVYRTDGAWHTTYWIAEWPRVDVGPDFLSPLLLAPSARRAVAVVMAPIPPGQAAREVEAARTADLADEQLRRRAGFLTTARRQRAAEGVVRRESELADGHAEYRFSGYVTVSAAERTDLDAACAEIEQLARQANLELRCLWGQQAEAFTWTLPLGRGLR